MMESCAMLPGPGANAGNRSILLTTLKGHAVSVSWNHKEPWSSSADLLSTLWKQALWRDTNCDGSGKNVWSTTTLSTGRTRRMRAAVPPPCHLQLKIQGRQVTPRAVHALMKSDTAIASSPVCLSFSLPIRGGIDRQNRVGSKFGGGGVSSSQNAERERKDRLRRLAMESFDLAKDPYLMRNHLGTYECKLCLTLHTNEANYLAHTQGKKHQQGLAKRAHMEKLKAEREAQEGAAVPPAPSAAPQVPASKVRIGRPAYQVFKSRDPQTNQRCLSFELSYPEIHSELQPRHRFMSAFEQKVDLPANRNYQYLLFAAEPYETVAFKIPNETIDKQEDRFVTHWDAEDKKFTVTLYFVDSQTINGG